MENPYTHFYLYARGWYKKSENVVDDLKVLAGHYSGIMPKYITMTDIMFHLTHLAFIEVNRSGNPEYFFHRLVLQAGSENSIQACLNLLRYVEVTELNIGKPDYSILPKNETE